MYASKRVKTRTWSVTAKVTAEEEKQLKIRAGEAELTLSEWARQMLLQSVKTSPEARLILSEFIGVRTVLAGQAGAEIDLLAVKAKAATVVTTTVLSWNGYCGSPILRYGLVEAV